MNALQLMALLLRAQCFLHPAWTTLCILTEGMWLCVSREQECSYQRPARPHEKWLHCLQHGPFQHWDWCGNLVRDNQTNDLSCRLSWIQICVNMQVVLSKLSLEAGQSLANYQRMCGWLEFSYPSGKSSDPWADLGEGALASGSRHLAWWQESYPSGWGDWSHLYAWQ